MSKKTQNNSDVLHIVFGESAGGCLRQALRQARRKDMVIAFWDDLSFGPINPPDLADRAAWVRKEIGLPVEEFGFSSERNVRIILDDPLNSARKLKMEVPEFWGKVLSSKARRVIWVCRRSAHEYAGFLECVWRLADERFDVIDVTGVGLARFSRKQEPAMSVSELHPREFTENAVWGRAAPLTPTARERYREMWHKLRAENAPFRVVAGDDLVSAPITFYDDWLVSCTVSQWRKAARVIADTMAAAATHGHVIGDLVLCGRLQALAAAGRLESQGDLSKPRFSEVRLPRAEPGAA
jgi:uncharacterized protein DUF3658/uncharacterized protein DUF1835